jgi:hypothetical protein
VCCQLDIVLQFPKRSNNRALIILDLSLKGLALLPSLYASVLPLLDREKKTKKKIVLVVIGGELKLALFPLFFSSMAFFGDV